jgi:hypothetical protein
MPETCRGAGVGFPGRGVAAGKADKEPTESGRRSLATVMTDEFVAVVVDVVVVVPMVGAAVHATGNCGEIRFGGGGGGAAGWATNGDKVAGSTT